MNFIKRKKWLFLIIIPCLLIVVVAFLYTKKLVFYNNKGIYGDRLIGIEEVPIKQDLKNDVVSSLLILEEITKASMDIRGKIINILVSVEEDVDITRIKQIMDEILIKWTDEHLDFYDMQFFVSWKMTEDNEKIPLIGYKSRYSPVIVWEGI